MCTVSSGPSRDEGPNGHTETAMSAGRDVLDVLAVVGVQVAMRASTSLLEAAVCCGATAASGRQTDTSRALTSDWRRVSSR